MKLLKFYFLFFWILSLSLVSNAQKTAEGYEVSIYFKTFNGMFPDEWYEPKIDANAESLSESESERSMMIVQKALNKYPPLTIKQNLKRLFVLKSIRFFGAQYGGTNSLDAVYIANKGVENNYDDEFIEQTFHHEFSSILLRNYYDLFDQQEWLKQNPLEFEYGNGGIQALLSGKSSTEMDSSLCKLGFLCEYSTASIEEDVNMLAENLFLPSSEFSKMILKYPILQNKILFLIRFYNKINSNFTPFYFSELQKASLKN